MSVATGVNVACYLRHGPILPALYQLQLARKVGPGRPEYSKGLAADHKTQHSCILVSSTGAGIMGET